MEPGNFHMLNAALNKLILMMIMLTSEHCSLALPLWQVVFTALVCVFVSSRHNPHLKPLKTKQNTIILIGSSDQRLKTYSLTQSWSHPVTPLWFRVPVPFSGLLVKN